MKWRLMLPVAALLLASPAAWATLHVVIVQGLGGESDYESQFAEETAALRKAALTLTDAARVQVLAGAQATKAALQAALRGLPAVADDRLELFLVGHGSFDGSDYKFNISGADLSGAELAQLLNALPMRAQLVVATGSSSGALQDLLKSNTRVVVTATRSGSERNATRFGREFAAALTDSAADNDKNGTVSVQEAFDFAQRGVKQFYERDVRLASEHAVLRGDSAARFPLQRLGGAGATDAAPAIANPARDKITAALDALRLRKSELPEEQYNAQLEELLLQLAEMDAAAAPAGATP